MGLLWNLECGYGVVPFRWVRLVALGGVGTWKSSLACMCRFGCGCGLDWACRSMDACGCGEQLGGRNVEGVCSLREDFQDWWRNQALLPRRKACWADLDMGCAQSLIFRQDKYLEPLILRYLLTTVSSRFRSTLLYTFHVCLLPRRRPIQYVLYNTLGRPKPPYLAFATLEYFRGQVSDSSGKSYKAVR